MQQSIHKTTRRIDGSAKNIDETTKKITGTAKEIYETTQGISETTKEISEATKGIEEKVKKIDESTKKVDEDIRNVIVGRSFRTGLGVTEIRLSLGSRRPRPPRETGSCTQCGVSSRSSRRMFAGDSGVCPR